MIDKLQVGSGGWTNPYFSGLIKYIPQAIGAFIGGVSIVYFRARFIFKDMRVFIARSTHRNIIDGFIYASGMICYLYSAFLLNNETNKEIIGGQGIDAGAGATAFALTNFANIVSAFGGIFILKEKFTKHELIYFIAGALVITGAAIMVTFTDSMPFLATWGKTQPIIKSSYIVYPYITP
jgi:glucose uptake protein GlcU